MGALVAASLRQSLVLGYILAGLVLGPNVPGIEVDELAVEQLAEVGIILLMFAIGVQLSFSDMLRVGPIALIGGNIQVLTTIGVGFGVGQALGWPTMESLFFGAVISNSSSTVLSKVLAERGEEDSLHGRIGLAWSSVQDFGTVVLVVVLTALAEGDPNRLPLELTQAVALAGAFLVIGVPAGLLLLPRFFAYLSRLGNHEVFVLSTAGIALGVAALSSVFGISVALGAFIGGIVVGRSDISHEIFGQIRPLRDIFSGLFFVSVGMLIEPDVVLRNLHLVILTCVLIIGFKGTLSAGIALAFRYRGRTAVMTGAVLGQCAEFSFLMATVGAQLGEVSDKVFGVMLAGAALSIVIAPYSLRLARPLGDRVERRLPIQVAPERLEDAPIARMKGHAILCGYGRVGRIVYESLVQRAIPCVVIEQDAGLVRELQAQGAFVLQGSASNQVMLERAGLEAAAVLVVALPDPYSVRRIVEIARDRRPDLEIVVRTHTTSEREFMETHGANEAVLGELELALEMSRHTLQYFDVDIATTNALLQRVREESAQ